MTRICAWCGVSLGPDVEPLEDTRLTHGCCDACRDRIDRETDVYLAKVREEERCQTATD